LGSRTVRRRRHRRFAVGLPGALVVLLGISVLPAAPSVPAESRALYVVQLAAEPLASFAGEDGYPATSPKITGAKLDPHGPDSRAWRAKLDGMERRVLTAADAAAAPVAYRFRTAIAGFAAWLTAGEKARLGVTPGVSAITRSRRIPRPPPVPRPVGPGRTDRGAGGPSRPAHRLAGPHVTGTATAAAVDSGQSGDVPDLLGLPGGLWAQLGGPEQAGDGIVVGVVDDGIVVDHPSFADQPTVNGVPNYIGAPFARPAGWNGVCQDGVRFGTCNNKVIGARFFVEGFGADNVDLAADELSPLSVFGHGVAVSAVAAGNYGVNPTIRGNDLGVGTISGIAPRAQLAAYKVFWQGDGPHEELALADLVAAIDAAVADGVDVINLSIGLSPLDPTAGVTNVTDPVSAATLAAFDAGIVLVAAEGNAGPEFYGGDLVPGGRPWILAAGASTVARQFNATATIASGAPGGEVLELSGESLTEGLGAVPLVAGSDIPAPGAQASEAARCLFGTLDPARAAGRAVVCTREPSDYHLDQVTAAAAAGAAAAVVPAAPGGRGLVNFPIPGVVVEEAAIPVIDQFLTGAAAPTLTLTPASAGVADRADRVSHFSSRGPAPSRFLLFPGDDGFFEAEFIKPDVVAPGEEILAATVPGDESFQCHACTPAGSFATLSGTSFSTPVTAGAAALLLDRHPEWTPSAVRSAFATTAAAVTLDDGVTPTTAFDAGGGRIDPTRAAAPGLVLRASGSDFLRYQEGVDPRAVPGDLDPIEATDLNLPGIAFDYLAGARTTRRTFTSVDPRPARWALSVEGLPGVTTTASPSTFTIDPGQTQAVDLTFAAGESAAVEHVFGAVVLTNPDDGRTIRIPVALLPNSSNIVLPPVESRDPSGRAGAVVESGFTGAVSAVATGLAAPAVQPDQPLGFSPLPLGNALPGPGLNVHDLDVPSDAQLLRVQLGNVDGADFWSHISNLDVYVLQDGDGNGFQYPGDVIASAAGASGFESVAVTDPAPGSYRVLVHRVDDVGPAVTTYDLTTWIAADPSPDDLTSPPGPGVAATADPVVVAPGDTVAIPIDYAGLSVPGTHLGIVTFYDAAEPSPRRVIESRLFVVHYDP
jgi:subtilisin family serine protease